MLFKSPENSHSDGVVSCRTDGGFKPQKGEMVKILSFFTKMIPTLALFAFVCAFSTFASSQSNATIKEFENDFESAIYVAGCNGISCSASGTIPCYINSKVTKGPSDLSVADILGKNSLLSYNVVTSPIYGIEMNVKVKAKRKKTSYLAFVPKVTTIRAFVGNSTEESELKAYIEQTQQLVGSLALCNLGSVPSSSTCQFVQPDNSESNATNQDTKITKNFIKLCSDSARSGQLCDGDKTFRFVSFYIANMIHNEDGAEDFFASPVEQADAASTISLMSGRVGRTYTLLIGEGKSIEPFNDGDSKFKLSQKGFDVLDSAIYEAGRHNIRLIIPFINEMFDDDNYDYIGNYGLFARLYGKDKNGFYTDEGVQKGFESLIEQVLNHQNSKTGVVLKDDPTIFAFQLGNELDEAPKEWSQRMAKKVKSLAPDIMVMAGQQSRANMDKNDIWSIKDIDLVGIHVYGQFPSENDHEIVDYMHKQSVAFNKAFIYDEFAFADDFNNNQNFLDVLFKSNAAGALCWSLRYHSRKGGFYSHWEKGPFYSYHAPGFHSGRNGDNNGFGADEYNFMQLMLKNARKFAGVDDASFPTPVDSPQLIDGSSRKSLSWVGSAWAEKYEIAMKSSESGEYKIVAEGVSDNYLDGSDSGWKDETADGSTKAWYRITPIGRSGGRGPSLETSPIS